MKSSSTVMISASEAKGPNLLDLLLSKMRDGLKKKEKEKIYICPSGKKKVRLTEKELEKW